MNSPHIIILGGYGMTGRQLAEILLRETSARLALAGRTLPMAQAFADDLNRHFPGERVHGVFADASDPVSLQTAFQGKDIVVAASSTAIYARQVVCAALEAGIDYLDVQYSPEKNKQLQILDGQIHEPGLRYQALAVEPVRFLADMERLGARGDCELLP